MLQLNAHGHGWPTSADTSQERNRRMRATTFGGSVCLGALLAALTAASNESVAHADVSDQIYSDAQKLIEDLISRELAHSVVPTLACVAPDLRNYYPRTLQRLYDLQLDGIKASVREETADAVGYLVYKGIGQLSPPPVTPPAPAANTRQTAPDDRFLLKSVPIIARYAGATTNLDLNAELQRDSNQDDAYTRMLPSPGATNAHRDPETVLSADPVAKPSFDECKKQEVTYFAEGRYLSGNSVCPPNAQDGSACQAADVKGWMERHCTGAYYTPGDAYRCELALAARSTVLDDSDAASRSYANAFSAIVVERLNVLAGSSFDARTFQRMYEQVALRILKYIGSGSALNAGDLSTEVASAIATSKHPTGQPSPAAIDNERTHLGELISAVDRLGVQWRTAIGTKGKVPDLAAFFNTVGGATGALEQICSAVAPAPAPAPVGGGVALPADVACQSMRNSQLFQAGKSFAAIAHAAGEKKYREVAILAIRDMLPTDTCTDPNAKAKGQCLLRAQSRKFLESLVSYVADLQESGATSAATSAAVRSSLENLILDLGQGGGVDRHWWSRIIVPQFSLNYSWNAGFINEAGGDGVRPVASIDELNISLYRWRRDLFYASVGVNLLDLLGPFSEIALRRSADSADYKRPEAAWLLFVHPRLEAAIGSPAVSKHLAATINLGLRTAAAYSSAGELAYTSILDDTAPVPTFTRFLDFGIGIKYLP